MESLNYCLDTSLFPPNEVLPGICTYGPDSIWFGIIGSQIENKGDSLIVPLFNKQYDRNKNGTVIPVTDREDVSQNLSKIKVPPTVKVDFYTDELCQSNPVYTVGGTFLQYYGHLNYNAYGTADLKLISPSVRCMKMTQVEEFSTFIEQCENGTTPQAQCRQYASTNTNQNQSGTNNTNSNFPNDNFVPDNARGFFYTMVFLGIFIIIMIVIIMMWSRNDQINTREHLNKKSYNQVKSEIDRQNYFDRPGYVNQSNDLYNLYSPSAPPLSDL